MLDVKATGNAAACCWWFVTHRVSLAQLMYMQTQRLVMPLDILNVKKLWLPCTTAEDYSPCMASWFREKLHSSWNNRNVSHWKYGIHWGGGVIVFTVIIVFIVFNCLAPERCSVTISGVSSLVIVTLRHSTLWLETAAFKKFVHHLNAEWPHFQIFSLCEILTTFKCLERNSRRNHLKCLVLLKISHLFLSNFKISEYTSLLLTVII